MKTMHASCINHEKHDHQHLGHRRCRRLPAPSFITLRVMLLHDAFRMASSTSSTLLPRRMRTSEARQPPGSQQHHFE